MADHVAQCLGQNQLNSTENYIYHFVIGRNIIRTTYAFNTRNMTSVTYNFNVRYPVCMYRTRNIMKGILAFSFLNKHNSKCLAVFT